MLVPGLGVKAKTLVLELGFVIQAHMLAIDPVGGQVVARYTSWPWP